MYIRQGITFFLLLGFFIIFIISSCGDDPTGFDEGLSRSRSPSSSNREIRQEACQEHQSCSGEDCCRSDNDCKNICKKLFSGENYGVCINEYDRELVERLETLEETLKRPNGTNLVTVDTESLCALLQLSPNKWLEEINRKYTPGNAEEVIKWMFSTGVLHLFSGVEERLDLVKSLLAALANRRGQITTVNILNGLARSTVDDRVTVFYIADYVGNRGKSSFEFIHNELVVGDICDVENNQPFPNSTGTRNGGNCYYNDLNTGQQFDDAREYRPEACVLALYCLAGADNRSKADRRRVANLVSTNSGVTDFIDAAVVDGGLGVTEASGEWPSAACTALKDFWHNRSLNFGLGAAQNFPSGRRSPCPR